MKTDHLQPGPEFDQVVLRVLFDGKADHDWLVWPGNLFRLCSRCGGQYRIQPGEQPVGCAVTPPFSTDMRAAWLVVRKMNDRMTADNPPSGGPELVLVQDETSGYRSRWWARFDGKRDAPLGIETGWACASDHGEGFAPALAICRAALAGQPEPGSSR